MAQYSTHPLAAPPAAPPRKATGHLLLRALSIFLVFSFLASNAWTYSLGLVGAGALLIVLGIVVAVVWAVTSVRRRAEAPFPWRRLPWSLLGYLAWALLSSLWSAWAGVSLATWLLLLLTTLCGLFLGHVLTWREIVRVTASAAKWALGLSIAIELWVVLVVRHPIFPNFFTPPSTTIDPQWYWVRGNLFNGGRLQGIVGNANALAAICVIAILVFAIRIALRAPRRPVLWAWIALAAFLFVRAASATMIVAAVVAAVVVAMALLMRRASRTETRRHLYLLFGALGVGGALVAWLLRDTLLGLLGKEASLTGRTAIWEAVSQRAAERPLFGWGFATPWGTWDPAFSDWLFDHGMPVFHAHSVWLDVRMQLGVVGVVLLAIVYATFAWRAWFFAIDRPRWDLDATRPYSPVSLLPLAMLTILLVQGITESTPLLLWGWLFLTMLLFKVKIVGNVDVGPFELEREIAPARPRHYSTR